MPEIPFQRSILKLGALLVLAVVLAGPGSVIPVRAGAGLPQSKTWPVTHATVTLRINIPSHELCLNQDYPVHVTPSEAGGDYTDLKGVVHGLAQTNLPAVKVEAFVVDTGVATIKPARAVTGWDQPKQINGVQAASFMLHASKPGETRVYFETLVFGQYASQGVDIKVKLCKYKVTITSNLSASVPNLSVQATGNGEGKMKAEGGDLTGSASLDWSVFAFSKCFTHDLVVTVPPNATLKGSLSQDGRSITVHIDFQPVVVSSSSSATCYGGGGSSNTSAFTPPSIDFTVPVTGGGTRHPIPITWGELDMKGSAVINVTPEEDD